MKRKGKREEEKGDDILLVVEGLLFYRSPSFA